MQYRFQWGQDTKSKKSKRLAIISAIVIVALIVSVACIADYYHNNSKIELIPPGSTSPFIIGEVEVVDKP